MMWTAAPMLLLARDQRTPRTPHPPRPAHQAVRNPLLLTLLLFLLPPALVLLTRPSYPLAMFFSRYLLTVKSGGSSHHKDIEYLAGMPKESGGYHVYEGARGEDSGRD